MSLLFKVDSGFQALRKQRAILGDMTEVAPFGGTLDMMNVMGQILGCKEEIDFLIVLRLRRVTIVEVRVVQS